MSLATNRLIDEVVTQTIASAVETFLAKGGSSDVPLFLNLQFSVPVEGEEFERLLAEASLMVSKLSNYVKKSGDVEDMMANLGVIKQVAECCRILDADFADLEEPPKFFTFRASMFDNTEVDTDDVTGQNKTILISEYQD